MTEDELLFAAALANPAEDTPRLVLADWFDEHDEPDLAAALRAEPRLIAFLADLTRWDAPPRWNAARDRPAQRDIDTRRFSRAGCRLLARFRTAFPVPPEAPTEFSADAPPARAVTDPLDPNSFLWRWLRARQRQIDQLRERAARAASASDEGRISPTAPEGGEAFEYSACLLHELVVRRYGGPIACDALERAMRARGHPLAWLPPWLLPVESELREYLPRFGTSGFGSVVPRNEGEPIGALPDAPAGGPKLLGADALTEDAPLFAAVRGWAEDSNGELEGVVCRLDRPLPAGAGRNWFAALPADSLAGARTEPDCPLNRLTPAGALAQLFAAAQSGGAYGGREWSAYGRLRAWQSFGALAGCAADADAVGTAAEATRCEWFSFGGTDWFYDLVDLGLICVRPDRRSVALLAATDTD